MSGGKAQPQAGDGVEFRQGPQYEEIVQPGYKIPHRVTALFRAEI